MNIIETVKSILQEFPKIDEVCNEIHVDFTDSEPTNYGLSSTGDTLLKTDVVDNQTRQHNFVLYAIYQSMNDYDRMNNSGTILELQTWLERYADGHNITVDDTGVLTKLTCANGMLYAIPNGNETDGWQYQLQIIARYEIN